MAKLKRARNSLLGINKLPPRVLGKIFQWNVMLYDDFAGVNRRSYNFMFVCHHWFEVSRDTPELWGFWGTTLKDWMQRYLCPEAALLDLILDDTSDDTLVSENLNKTLIKVLDALQDRASKDTIRRVHLKSKGTYLLNSILSSLTLERDEFRCSRMESFILQKPWYCDESEPVDVSDFFASYCFPKLQRLDLIHCLISSWDHLISKTGTLTNLHLDLKYPSPNPTTSQLLSILASNPLLQRIKLILNMAPSDDDDMSSSHVQLHHLKHLKLVGDF